MLRVPGHMICDATRSGTLGARQALSAGFASECRREDVQVILACHEIELPGGLVIGR